ncbi:hypothetical protein TH30_08285 [Thalassospira profundimaris]|uniref:Uncharacterized protein n=1 Tax=Thalassospira profundimaris TaxID=502049 RepID=A0A367X0Q5_9PROT|nr:hypothetical protein TH30_08285 [Thalassospira profundimaris]
MLKEVFKISSIGAVLGILSGLIAIAIIEPTTSQGNILIIVIFLLTGAIIGAAIRALASKKSQH